MFLHLNMFKSSGILLQMVGEISLTGFKMKGNDYLKKLVCYIFYNKFWLGFWWLVLTFYYAITKLTFLCINVYLEIWTFTLEYRVLVLCSFGQWIFSAIIIKLTFSLRWILLSLLMKQIALIFRWIKNWSMEDGKSILKEHHLWFDLNILAMTLFSINPSYRYY